LAAVKAVHVTPYFAPAFRYGGPPQSILGLCKALSAAGVDVDVFTTTANGDEPLPRAPDGTTYEGVHVRYFPLAWPTRYWYAAGLGEALARTLGSADLVHVHGLWNFTGWTGIRRARAARVPYVMSPRGMFPPMTTSRNRVLKTAAYWGIERRNLTRAAFLHATSDAEAGVLTPLGTRVLTIPNGVSPRTPAPDVVARFRRHVGFDADSDVVAFLGRLHPIKRLDLLAEAFTVVSRTHPTARLVIAGPDEGNHRRAVEPLFAPVSACVRWVGPLEEHDKWALLGASRVLVQCSDSESFGLSVAEALAVGVPVVVTARGPCSEVEAAGCGYRVAHDAASIGSAIAALLDAPDLARAMGERGAGWARRRFSWESIGRRMREAYEEALQYAPAVLT
jgi:glycosyltransferase involved in cell wall biosynthesis